MVTTTRKQQEQLFVLYKRQNWIKQHRQSQYTVDNSIMVVGIEIDGYPHT